MHSVDNTREISLVSASSNCDNHHFDEPVNICFSEVSIGEDHFCTGDFVLIKTADDYEVARLRCMFLTFKETIVAVVRRYIFARNLKTHLKRSGYDLDETSEVVEDASKECFIDLHQIIGRCKMNLLMEDEDPGEYLLQNKLDAKTNFIIRYSLLSNKLHPILSEQTILTEKSLNSPTTRLCRAKKHNMGSENTPTGNIKELKPANANKSDVVSTPRRNSVKRNLNKSFGGDSPQDKNNSILNYSIVNITDDEDDKPLVVRLRISDKSVSKENGNEENSSPQVRKSRRNVARQSYTDYVSPKKITPIKRLRSKKSSTSEDEEFSPSKTKLWKNTPRTLTRSTRRNSTKEVEVSSKRKTTTPKGFVDYLDSPRAESPRRNSARKSLRFVENDKTSSPRSVGRRVERISYDEDDLAMGTSRINLDDSMRTRILKVNINKLDVDGNEDDLEKKAEQDEDNGVATKTASDNESTEGSQVMKTPRSKRKPKKYTNSSDNDSDFLLSTPKSRKKISQVLDVPKPSTPEIEKVKPTPRSTTKGTPRSAAKQTPSTTKQTPKTPRNCLKLIREGVVTPSMHARSGKVKGDSTPLMTARSRLHVSYVPDSLPCREKEYCDVFNFIEGKLFDRCGGCMYISGVPGTGKTATVTSVINNLSQNEDVPKFTFVNINGMRLSEPRQSYVEISKQLTGKTVHWEQAQRNLEDMFIKAKKSKPVVMLIDELDILCTKRQDVVYNLLDWPSKAKNQLVVITIANTMDLPERLLMSRVTSRLGLTRLTFHAYTHKQLQEIVTKRLFGTDSFNPDAVQFVARKVASVSGDARRALDICRRAAEIAEREGKAQLVSMNHVNEALNAMITQPKIRAIKSCSRLEQLILQSIVAEVERTGVEETTFADVFKMLGTCAAIEGFRQVSVTVAILAVYRLSACRLVLTDQKCNDIHQRIILNVSADDVHYAMKTD
ncbi:hypothetical protein JTB14_020100 [Gonioctena quinquepunctata]|nr:hypothetical protein JTB14_020100 [Gonioctena quinquepunctata]